MKEKNIKFILELIFIFILPLCLLATCFKQEKVYDENNNEVGKYLTFDNIFILSEEKITYYNYEYYNIDEIVYYEVNTPILLNYNKSIFNKSGVNTTNLQYRSYYYNPNYNYVKELRLSDSLDIVSTANYSLSDINITNNDYETIILRLDYNIYFQNNFGNLIKKVNSYTIGDNVVNRLLNYLYDSLGITSNWILQFIVIYTLLWLIMWFIWHILYLPLDFICSKLLFDRVDK